MRAFNRRVFVGALAFSLMAGAALAQAPISFIAGDRVVGRGLKVNPQVAIPSYAISFITDQQATAAASIEARARLTASLTGVGPVKMRELANEAHADLKAKLIAAGFTIASDAVAVSAAQGVAPLPNNMEIKPLVAGITIGKGVQKAWVVVGADKAPALDPLVNPDANPAKQMGMLGAGRLLSQGSRKISATLILPSLIVDFVNMDASTGMGRANIESRQAFSIRQGSSTLLVSTQQVGPAVSMSSGLMMPKDITDPTPFATVAQGEAAVRALSTGPTDGLGNRNSRGDAFVVNLPVWEGLVRKHFQAYNAALVAQLVKAR